MKRLRTFQWLHWSPNLFSVVVPDSSEVIDGDSGRRLSSFCKKTGVSRRSRFGCCSWSFASSSDRLRLPPPPPEEDRELVNRQFVFGFRILHVSVHPTSASDVSSAAAAAAAAASRPMSSGMGLSVPPRSTVSTAAWHTCQFPVQRSPTAPFTGFTVLPHASKSSDWNRAA